MTPEESLQAEKARLEARISRALDTYPAHAVGDQERLKVVEWLLGKAPFTSDVQLEQILSGILSGQVTVPGIWPPEIAREYVLVLLSKWAQ